MCRGAPPVTNFALGQKRKQISTMERHIKILAALGITGLTGLLLAALALMIKPIGEHRHETGATLAEINTGGVGLSDPAFYAEMANVNIRMHDDMKISRSGNIDRDFVRMMIPHHQGAIDMARVLLKYGQDERLKRLAQSIIVEQGQEITYMRTLVDAPSNASTPRIADQ
jgi:uncharacterized protein (DUF305 family)